MKETTPLEAEIRRLISVAGPMPVSEFMALCLAHPQHGYYATRDPFGSEGDFTTAPEISQMFGELIGLWSAAVWKLMGSPEPVHVVELGPGRGTLMSDLLRAARVIPGFHAALSVHLVEISPTLEQRQRQTLSGTAVPLTWHRSLEDVPDGPVIIVANEFIDALPVHQAIKRASGWHERVVEIDGNGNLAWGAAAEPIPHFERLLPPAIRNAPEGALFEWRSDTIPLALARRVVRASGAALIIDYGHTRSSTGETMQAVHGHGFADPLRAPGMVDLTAHVDFQALANAAESMGAAVHGPIEQRHFLRNLGIENRAAALKSRAPDKAAAIEAALLRLTDDSRTGMGCLFKAIGLADPKLGALPGFEG